MDGEEEELPVQEAVQPLKEPPGNWSVSSFSFERMERHRKLTVAPLEEATSAADGEPRPASWPSASSISQEATEKGRHRLLVLPPCIAISSSNEDTSGRRSWLPTEIGFPHAALCGHFICTAANASAACIMRKAIVANPNFEKAVIAAILLRSAVHMAIERPGSPS
jgi:hypothetical protein